MQLQQKLIVKLKSKTLQFFFLNIVIGFILPVALKPKIQIGL